MPESQKIKNGRLASLASNRLVTVPILEILAKLGETSRCCVISATSPRASISPSATGAWKTQPSNAGDPLPVFGSTSGPRHVMTLVGGGSAMTDYQSWLGADGPAGRGGILGRRRAAGRVGRSTVTFLSPVRDGRPSCGLTAALDDRPYAATLKADRSSTVPLTVTASASLPRRRHEVWPMSAGCPQCSPRSSQRTPTVRTNGSPSTDCGRCRDRAPSCVTDGRLAPSGDPWPTCRATPSEWPLNDDSANIEARLHSAEDTPV